MHASISNGTLGLLSGRNWGLVWVKKVYRITTLYIVGYRGALDTNGVALLSVSQSVSQGGNEEF